MSGSQTWNASGSGFWDVAGNWSGNVVPNNSGELVTLAYGIATSPYTITIKAGENYGIGTLVLGTSSTISQGVTLSNLGTLGVSTGGIKLYLGTEILSSGALNATSGLIDYGTLIANGSLYIADSGTVEAGGLLQIGQSGSGDIQTDLYDYGQVTVQGQFTDPDKVFGNGAFLVNGGTVSAQGGGSYLNIASSSIAFTIENGGSLSVTNAGSTGNSFAFGAVTTQDNVLTMPSYSGTVTTKITGFGPGDVINVGSGGSNWTHSITPNGDGTYTVSYGAPYNQVTFTDVTLAPGVTAADIQFQNGNIVCVCFVKGTRIRTARGEVSVEALRVGDTVTTLSGERPVRWVGRRRIDLALHQRPRMVAPVRVRCGAFADNVPCRDLLVSPDHAIFVDGMLISARQLLNGTTILQEATTAPVEYFHIELDEHAILLAEGLPAESYLPTDNRGFFEIADAPVVLHPDLTDAADDAGRAAMSCHPFVSATARVRPVWQRLADRATAQGWSEPTHDATTDPALCVGVAGKRLRPVHNRDGLLIFVLPRGVTEVRLLSRAAAPADLQPWLDDRRRLGVNVQRITVRDGDAVVDIPLDGPALAAGWWDVELSGVAMHRWTDGKATIFLPLGSGRAALLELRIGDSLPYPESADTARRHIAVSHRPEPARPIVNADGHD